MRLWGLIPPQVSGFKVFSFPKEPVETQADTRLLHCQAQVVFALSRVWPRWGQNHNIKHMCDIIWFYSWPNNNGPHQARRKCVECWSGPSCSMTLKMKGQSNLLSVAHYCCSETCVKQKLQLLLMVHVKLLSSAWCISPRQWTNQWAEEANFKSGQATWPICNKRSRGSRNRDGPGPRGLMQKHRTQIWTPARHAKMPNVSKRLKLNTETLTLSLWEEIRWVFCPGSRFRQYLVSFFFHRFGNRTWALLGGGADQGDQIG